MSAPGSVAAALAEAGARGVDRLDARWLLGHLLGRPATWLLAHGEAPLDAAQAAAWQDLLDRRAAGEPFAYLVGRQEFHGLALAVDPAVLVPRPDTEVLVDWAIECLAGRQPGGPDIDAEPRADAGGPRVLDLGTGSGAIALALRQACPQARVTATDLSPAALAVARANAARLGLPVEFRAGDWWTAVGEATYDLIVSNPPYIAGGDPHLAALRHEPMLALSPGGDGLDALRAIAAGAREHLVGGGWLLLEHGHDQGEAVQALLRTNGFAEVRTRRDLGGRPRCTGGRRQRAG